MSAPDGRPVAFVTGAGSGLGRASSVALAPGGFQVIPTDLAGSAAATAVLLGEDHGAWLDCDVSSTASVDAAIAEVGRRFCRLDAVVSNAGIVEPVRTEDETDERWHRLLSVNQDGALRVARRVPAAARGAVRIAHQHLVRRRAPRIPGSRFLRRVKGALEALTRVLAVEWGRTGSG